MGLKPGGVERLGESLLAAGLRERIEASSSVILVSTRNSEYSFERDEETNCLNPIFIVEFSKMLIPVISNELERNDFPLVLGGDCSILAGVMPALKSRGSYGLIFMDAHSDFYTPDQSPTGELADMDLGIVTGHGPELLNNINGLGPYVNEEQVIHLGQRDAIEVETYHAPDIRKTPIHCYDLEMIREQGLTSVSEKILDKIDELDLDGFWIHFDTDVIADDENPAVDYRLPGGLSFEEAKLFLTTLLGTKKIVGMTVTIFNPDLDPKGSIAEKITACLSEAFKVSF